MCLGYPALLRTPHSALLALCHTRRAVRWRVVAVGALWTGTWWVIIGALIAPLLPGRWTAVLVLALAAIAPLLVLVRRFGRVYPSAWTRLWVFRPFYYVQLGTPLVALCGVLGCVIGSLFGAALSGGRWALLLATGTVLAASLAGYLGTRWLRVVALDARFSALPVALDGMRIVQVSDLHVGPHTSRRHLAKVFQAVQRARPDLIAVTGDHVDDYPGDFASFAAAFRGMSAPCGVFAVAGNHDVYAGWAEGRAGLEAMGMTVLVNDAVEIVRGDARFWVAGTGDPAGIGARPGRGAEVSPDIARTVARIPSGAFTIALAHNPALWPALADRGVPLTLSGHTHHGQLAIPLLGWSVASLFLQHAMGWHRRHRSLLYINPGTNFWGIPFRLGAWPEVTVLTLRRAEIEVPDIAPTAPASVGFAPARNPPEPIRTCLNRSEPVVT